MPKIKSNRSIRRRFRFTGSGKIHRAQGFRRHLLTGKSGKRKRQLRRGALLRPVDEEKVKILLPYR
jgi:large subunit ribosomal protein L35